MPVDFTEIYETHVWQVHGFLGYRLRSRSDVEDLTQLTFERALRSWATFDPARASPRTWLLTIARNLMIDHLRRDHSAILRPIGDEGVSEDELPSVEPEVDLGIDPDLSAALATLGSRERELIALRFGGDMTGPEIAEVTGLSLANVQQILSRSLRKLRTCLAD